MSIPSKIDLDKLHEHIARLRGNQNEPPTASIIIPVNAQGDLINVLRVICDIIEYKGTYSLQIILVINNYSPEKPPPEIEIYRNIGLEVIGIPNVRRPGEAVGFTARIPGLRKAASEFAILFDADVCIPNSTELINWYIKQLKAGAALAYTHVDYFELLEHPSVRSRIKLHHLARWVKRVVLKIPTARGSNYALTKSLVLELYDKGMLADEMNVGPTFKAVGKKVVYSKRKNLTVLTSGRMFNPGWIKIIPYFYYRLKYNYRVLPVCDNVAACTDRENDPVRRYDENNRPLK